MKTQIINKRTVRNSIAENGMEILTVKIGTFTLHLHKRFWTGSKVHFNKVNRNHLYELTEIVKGTNMGINRKRVFTLPKGLAKQLKKVVNFKIDDVFEKVSGSGPFGPCEQLKIGK